MKTKDILIAAKELLSKPGAWGKHHYAVDHTGAPVRTLEQTACRFCAVGVIARVNGWDNGLSEAQIILERHIPSTHVGRRGLTCFNDRQETVEPVLELFDKAIASCE